MKKRYFFVFDVEAMGLFGPSFAVGWTIVDETGKTLQEGLYRLVLPLKMADLLRQPHHRIRAQDPQWIRENVTPVLDKCTDMAQVEVEVFGDMRDLLPAFWKRWTELKAEFPGIVMAADCLFPVEATFVMDAMRADDKLTMDHSPYPFIEIGTMLMANGKNPLADYDREPREMPVHNPLADARQSARLFIAAFRDVRLALQPA